MEDSADAVRLSSFQLYVFHSGDALSSISLSLDRISHDGSSGPVNLGFVNQTVTTGGVYTLINVVVNELIGPDEEVRALLTLNSGTFTNDVRVSTGKVVWIKSRVE